ncbi:MAG: histidine kinase [Paraburkholderia sp.]|jgi:hypothetical protein|uniref:sensor histidine kinase n=1 Tax=Burkholderiaceae TaxID=119060 RepID=UPI002016C11A|nr:histidine kinase [Burkholderia sp. 4M9327F10]
MPSYRIMFNWLWRELRITILIALASTFLFTPFSDTAILTNLIYSCTVTLCIQALIEAGRYGFSTKPVRPGAASPDTPSGNPVAQRRWPGWALMAPWVAMSAAVGYLGGHALGDLLTGTHHPAPGFLRNMQTLLPALAPAFAVSIGFTYFFYARGRLAASEAQAQAARRTAAENQLKLLVSQLEPHMLFNTLANLRVLIGQDPPRAQAMLDHLNGFLRATLDASRSDSHALSAEFARIADYLELMQVRMGPRLRGTLDLPADLSSLPVPPLLLQPLVENAVKHGLEPSVSGGQIEVSARRDGHGLCLSVRDTGVGLGAAAHGSRFGMQQVRERLVALYGDAASLELTTPADGRGGALAVVRLPVA